MNEAIHYLPSLDDDLLTEAAHHTHASWGETRTRAEHASHVRRQIRDSRGIAGYVGLHDGERLLCSAKRYLIQCASPHGPLAGIGIGAVYTPEPVRGHGHASRLVRAMLADARHEGLRMALLFSDIDPTFYETLGFTTLSHLTWNARVAALPPSKELATQPCDDVTRLLSLYESSWEPDRFRMRRSADSWRYWSWRHDIKGTRLLRRGDDVVGYVTGWRHQDALWIADCALCGASQQQLWATLRAWAQTIGAQRVAGWLRPEHAGGPFVATARRQCIPMVAPLDVDLSDVRAHFAAFDHF